MSNSIFSMSSVPSRVKSTSAQEERAPRKLWINLGIPVTLGEKQTFINLPLVLTADDLESAIERETKKLKNSSTDEFTAIQEGKILIANQVQELFAKLQDGQSILASEAEQELVKRLQIQFYKAGDKELPSNSEEMRKGIFQAMLGK